jgi:hypothetical protein
VKNHALFSLALALATLPALGQQRVRFDQERYDVSPGETFAVRVLLDPVPETGLSSFGVGVHFNFTNAGITNLSAIKVPPALDFNGVAGSGAAKAVSADFASAKGTVNFLNLPQQSYAGSLLATFEVTDKSAGSHTLRVGFFNTLGVTEEIFTTGDGSVLDPKITFGSALVNYRPSLHVLSPSIGPPFVFAAPIPFLVEAFDPDGAIVGVKFCVGTNIIGQATNAPFSFTWTNALVGTQTVNIVAIDNLGAASSTNITIIVRSNAPPILAPIGDRVIHQGVLLTFTATATDLDAPPQSLAFSLDPGAPPGAAIHPASGVFIWTPTDAQNPGAYPITVRVTDDGVPALSDSETITAIVTAPIAESKPCAIFAGEPNRWKGSKVVNFNGNDHAIRGRIHSNSDIDVSGNNHVFRDGFVEFVTAITPSPAFGGKVTFVDAALTQSVVQPYPVSFALEDFAPRSAAAAEANALGKYFALTGDIHLDDFITNGELREGLYYVRGSVHLNGPLHGRVTIVATDEIQFTCANSTLESFTRCLLAFSGKTTSRFNKSAVSFSGSSIRGQGIVFAPEGGISVSGADNGVLVGSLIGRSVTVSGARFQLTGIDLRLCAPLVLPLTPVLSSDALQLAIPTVAGLNYVVEFTDSLARPAWQQLALVTGDGTTRHLRVSTTNAQRYYRLRLQ